MFDIWSYKFTATNIYVSNLWTIAFLGKSEIVVQKGNSDPGTNGNTSSNPNNYWKIRKKATVMNQKWYGPIRLTGKLINNGSALFRYTSNQTACICGTQENKQRHINSGKSVWTQNNQ